MATTMEDKVQYNDVTKEVLYLKGLNEWIGAHASVHQLVSFIPISARHALPGRSPKVH